MLHHGAVARALPAVEATFVLAPYLGHRSVSIRTSLAFAFCHAMCAAWQVGRFGASARRYVSPLFCELPASPPAMTPRLMILMFTPGATWIASPPLPPV